MHNVFAGWAAVFRAGPPELKLTGAWEYVDNPKAGRYQVIKADRDRVVADFERVAQFAQRVSEGRALFVLHNGI